MTTDVPHRRFNALTGSWVLVSPHRTQRPWQGRVEDVANHSRPHYDADCYLCPGNQRAGGEQNPQFEDVFVFDNDYPALLDVESNASSDPLLQREPVTGRCRVICYSPRHDLTMADMTTNAVGKVINVWAEEFAALSAQYRWVQIFENRGELMGCSNPHPHGQIWATDALPTEAARELERQTAYLADNGRSLLGDYIEREQKEADRVLIDNKHWIVIVPFWAVWPYETLLIAKDNVASLDELSIAARRDLATTLTQLCNGYDRLFDTPFPYSMGWHNAPAGNHPGWRLHAHFYPPLLRSATIKKFMVGYEMLAEPQRDLTPEMAAQTLRSVIPNDKGNGE